MPKQRTIGIRQPDVLYLDRHAVRFVALNTCGDIAVIYAEKGNYYKLPGGGIEKDEDHHDAAQREVEEETGAAVFLRCSGCIATTKNFATTSIRSLTVISPMFSTLLVIPL